MPDLLHSLPSFPRRRESWRNLGNSLFFFYILPRTKQDSRLRGNDGVKVANAV